MYQRNLELYSHNRYELIIKITLTYIYLRVFVVKVTKAPFDHNINPRWPSCQNVCLLSKRFYFCHFHNFESVVGLERSPHFLLMTIGLTA